MIPLRIVIRTRTPWETMTRESFMAQKDPKTPTEFVRMGKGVLPCWEEATGLSYYQYRARIRDLCEARLREILPVTVGLDGVDWDGPDEGLIPIDDDDLLKDSVVEIASRFVEGINLIIWHRVTNFLGRERLENPNFGGQLDTCNWAIRKSFLAKSFRRNDILTRHWHAAGLLAPMFGMVPKNLSMLEKARRSVQPSLGVKLKHESILEVPESHSTYYLHSGSISFLSHKMTNVKDPVEHIRKLPLHPIYNLHRLENQLLGIAGTITCGPNV